MIKVQDLEYVFQWGNEEEQGMRKHRHPIMTYEEVGVIQIESNKTAEENSWGKSQESEEANYTYQHCYHMERILLDMLQLRLLSRN